MLKVENLRTFNWEGALRSLRNPMNGDYIYLSGLENAV